MRSCKNKKRENSVTKLENKISAKKKNKRRYGTPRWMATTRCGSVGVYWVFFFDSFTGFSHRVCADFHCSFFFHRGRPSTSRSGDDCDVVVELPFVFALQSLACGHFLPGCYRVFLLAFSFLLQTPHPKQKQNNHEPEARNPLNERPSKGAINPRADSRKGRPCPK